MEIKRKPEQQYSDKIDFKIKTVKRDIEELLKQSENN